jgi:uncharacterized protein YdcH (DUF465 family)
MVHNQEDLRRRLAEQNPEFRKLMAEHASHESRLEELQGKATLDEAERVETVDLKKQKLQIKDKMERLLQEHAERTAGAGIGH